MQIFKTKTSCYNIPVDLLQETSPYSFLARKPLLDQEEALLGETLSQVFLPLLNLLPGRELFLL